MDRHYPASGAPPRLTPYPGDEPAMPWRRSARARLFAAVFLTTLAAGVVATLLQPAEYRSTATVLMSAPTAIDDQSQAADVQRVAIQRRILLGGEVTGRLLDALADTPLPPAIDAAYLRETLRVEPVADTNLVEMIARGPDGEHLPQLVDTWIDVYLEIRAVDIRDNREQTLQVVRDQLAGLEASLEEARETLGAYRAEHGIASSERGENTEIARLSGLNEALNEAIRDQVKTGARLKSLETAIARGKKVVPVSERDSVAEMETELRQLKSTLREVSKNYTMEYVRRQPRYRDIPDRIAELESELDQVYQAGQALELATARREHEAAAQTVEELRAQLEGQRQDAAAFTAIYATHESLVQDLARLEQLHREAQSRLVELRVNPVDRYPQVTVIDRPGPVSMRLGPDYRLWLGGSALAALLLGILCVWLYGFLGPRQRPAYVTLSGVHMYPQDAAGQLPPGAVSPRALERQEARLTAGEGSDGPGGADSTGPDRKPDPD